ncbi:MAG TPA: peptidoglycan DD-metalloendopeptidase family protein [Gaiellaceae bacterium]|jgi:murein DD-endopeptidase MepM/ murein hydrolase activator NlpD|nr:peptidoglycan DD-metalloendopeptidase family protein [Gaiellaceae bacterium]
MRTRLALALPLLVVALVLPAAARGTASISAGVAALQVALRAHGLYKGTIDGIRGPATTRAVRRLQKHARIVVDGVPGPQTRRALGRFARHHLGSRPLHAGLAGWDVAALQFELAEHGFPSGRFDGIFGPHVRHALRRFQHWTGLHIDAIAGRATLAALQRPAPHAVLPLAWPLTHAKLGDPFGPRGDSFHTGIDLIAPAGTPVYAARGGRVSYADWSDGYGFLVIVEHGHGERTFYAHLSRIDVKVGVFVGLGARVGLVGSTGHATGPHLHFEVRVRGAAVNPLTGLS